MYESNWYFWFGSADYMADDGASMENDHIDAALFTKLERFEGLLLDFFHSSPSSMTKELKPINLLAILCISNTLLPLLFI